MSRLSHLLTADPAKVQPWHAEHERKYNDRERFRLHKNNAARRGIEFRLTFDQWLTWWKETGHYDERGRTTGAYVMARKGDKGAYELGNIECLLGADNIRQAHLGVTRSEAVKQRMREGRRLAKAAKEGA
jgi:hypothetical protein